MHSWTWSKSTSDNWYRTTSQEDSLEIPWASGNGLFHVSNWHNDNIQLLIWPWKLFPRNSRIDFPFRQDTERNLETRPHNCTGHNASPDGTGDPYLSLVLVYSGRWPRRFMVRCVRIYRQCLFLPFFLLFRWPGRIKFNQIGKGFPKDLTRDWVEQLWLCLSVIVNVVLVLKLSQAHPLQHPAMKIMLVVDIQQARKYCIYCIYIVYLVTFPSPTKLLRCIILAFLDSHSLHSKQGLIRLF